MLVHGLLFNQRMHGPLARTLAKRGHRVVTVDLLGHGRSDRPDDMGEYMMRASSRSRSSRCWTTSRSTRPSSAARRWGPTSTLEVASAAPDRVRGMVVEMPVLDNALLGCALAFTPLMVALTLGEPLMKVVQAGAAGAAREAPVPARPGRRVGPAGPRPERRRAPGPVLRSHRPAPHERATFDTPTLIGHHRDPIHPFSDADALVNELPNARVIEAGHFFELRLDTNR